MEQLLMFDGLLKEYAQAPLLSHPGSAVPMQPPEKYAGLRGRVRSKSFCKSGFGALIVEARRQGGISRMAV